MLIAIEGIDGAGKTHIARLVADRLNRQGLPARYINKSDISFGEPFADSRLRLLRDILWPTEGEPSQDSLGTHFYLFMLVGWFSALRQIVARELGKNKTIMVLDGSQYRVIAKAHRRAKIALAQLAAYFSSAVEPDLVVLLHIDPALSWKRRTAFKETEMGRWDGHHGDPRDAYCTYQSSIQELLCQFSDKGNWLVVHQDQGTKDTDIVERICGHVHLRLRAATSLNAPAQAPPTTAASA